MTNVMLVKFNFSLTKAGKGCVIESCEAFAGRES